MVKFKQFALFFYRQLQADYNPKFLKKVSSSPVLILIVFVLSLTSIIILWAAFYRIKPTSHGVGLTVKRGIVNRVFTPIEGRVISVEVELGQEVRIGDVIAKIDNTKQLIDSSNRDQVSQISSNLTPAQLLAEEQSTIRQINATKSSMFTLQEQLVDNKHLLGKMDSLLSTNDISYSEYLQQLKSVDDIKIQLLALKGKSNSLESDLFKLTIASRSGQINDQQDAQIANYNLQLTKEIIARHDGIVSLIDVSPGDYVKEGDTIAQVNFKTGFVKGVFVMPADMAKRVKPGDQCLVSPAESPPERYGYVKATAESVGLLPTNPGEYQRRIGLDYTVQQLFNKLSKDNEGTTNFNAFPYLVVVNIDLEDDKPIWTTRLVPPWGFVSGSAADVQCVYDQWSPLQYIIPAFRKEAGYVRVS
ncbi:biotin/lipoyl-binding protein [bacterium]|nr:biotin/lipoyl-binding protein [bacterium]